jgi:hypothetical protein
MPAKNRKVALIGLAVLHLICDIAVICCPGAIFFHAVSTLITITCLGLELMSAQDPPADPDRKPRASLEGSRLALPH